MEPSKWQKEFHIDSEDRLFSRKPRLLSLRPSMKTLCIFAGAVVAIGVIFYVSQHTSPSIPDHELPTIQAPEKPFKTKPAAQESDQEPLKYKTIYQKLSAKQPDEKIEHLLKEPEEPIAPPPSLPEDFITGLMNEEVPETSPDFQQLSVDKETETRSSALSKTDKPLSPVTKNSDEKGELVEKQSSITISGSSIKTKKTNQDTPSMVSDKGTHWVQLASLKTREAVEREWKRLTALRNLKPLLESLKPVYGRVDMGESEGIRYRLRVGLFSYENAKTLCRKLKEQKVDCIVKKG
jgi:hypothetical protein